MYPEIDAIFTALLANYGTTRMQSHWQGQRPEVVRGYWASRLAGCDPHMIRYALENLPDFPPTVREFRAIAQRCPPPQQRLIEAKPSQADYERCRARSRALVERFGRKACEAEGND